MRNTYIKNRIILLLAFIGVSVAVSGLPTHLIVQDTEGRNHEIELEDGLLIRMDSTMLTIGDSIAHFKYSIDSIRKFTYATSTGIENISQERKCRFSFSAEGISIHLRDDAESQGILNHYQVCTLDGIEVGRGEFVNATYIPVSTFPKGIIILSVNDKEKLKVLIK